MSFYAVIKARPDSQVNDIFDWLDENARFKYVYNGTDMLSRELSFSFDREQDLILFLLRWA